MTQLAHSIAPTAHQGSILHATTTARFADSGDFSATAWQGEITRPTEQCSRNYLAARRLLAPAATTVLVAFMLPVDAAGSETMSPSSTLPTKSLERLAPVAHAVSPSDQEPVYGIYAPSRPKRVIHSEVVEFRTDRLPRRKPRIVSDDSFLAVIDDE